MWNMYFIKIVQLFYIPCKINLLAWNIKKIRLYTLIQFVVNGLEDKLIICKKNEISKYTTTF